jgi:zinc transporter ZupT
MSVRFTVDASAAIRELDRILAGPNVAKMEAALAAGYMTADSHVHVITGRLKASGHIESSTSETSWKGTMGFARHPGIFELARGDAPTMNHPDGGHFFFDPGGQEFLDGVHQELVDWVKNG